MKRVILAIAVMLLGACATPQSFDEGLVLGYELNGSLQKSAGEALRAKAIGLADAKRVQVMANTATESLDEALQVGCGKTPEQVKKLPPGTPLGCIKEAPKTAQEQLALATRVLQSLQRFITALMPK